MNQAVNCVAHKNLNSGTPRHSGICQLPHWTSAIKVVSFMSRDMKPILACLTLKPGTGGTRNPNTSFVSYWNPEKKVPAQSPINILSLAIDFVRGKDANSTILHQQLALDAFRSSPLIRHATTWERLGEVTCRTRQRPAPIRPPKASMFIWDDGDSFLVPHKPLLFGP